MSQQEGYPEPFVHDDQHGRGRTLHEAIEDAIRKKGASHGDVLKVTFYVAVSNPHVGEYIVDLG